VITDDERRVLQVIDARRSEVADLLRQLLRFKTVTPLMGERAEGDDYRRLQAFVASYLADLGFDVETWEADAASLKTFPGSGIVPDRDLSNMPILVGRREGRGRSLILNGHYDVVPQGVLENWSVPPFGGVVADGKVFGRGACDMKGGFAAMLQALRCIAEAKANPPGSLILESVPDEEQTSMGTLACCQRGICADAGLIPEPTDMRVLVAARGSFSGRITVPGRAGHSEETQPPWEQGGAVNAIMKAVKVLERLDALNAEWASRPEKRHKYLDPDVIVPTMIRGGEWDVMYPERVDITFTSDFVPATKDIRGEIQAALDRVAREDSWMREYPPVLDAPGWLYGAEVGEDEPIVRAASVALADLDISPKLRGCGSLTDMVHLVNYSKVPTVSIGPSTRTIHGPDEHVTIDDLVAVTKALALVILRWSGSDRATKPS
jgi:acetylornithine deacetylase